MIKVDTLPNFCNGKLYKRWENVCKLNGSNDIVASKTSKDGSTIMLMLTNNGKTRKLLTPNEKFIDTILDDGIKRTYKYEKIGENTIKGQMLACQSENNIPLINAAKWITKNLIPQKLFLIINPKHPHSWAFIPFDTVKETKSEFFGIGKRVQITEVLAKDFENEINPTPKTILLKTNKNMTEAITRENEDLNKQFVKHFGISSEVLGSNLRAFV